jgi:phage baseplate assembly protein W|tara:strand:+ start:698 stop:1141 length:444 start_codon:yes stop_codon:yes gene_type:complete
MPISTKVTQYGTVASTDLQKATVLKSPKLTGLNYPIPTDAKNGYFSKSTNLALIKSSLKSLLKTERGERFMRPDYGCDLRKFLMEPLDEATFALIKEEVSTAISRYLDSVSLGKIQVFETRTGELKVNLFCAVRDSIATNFEIGVRV